VSDPVGTLKSDEEETSTMKLIGAFVVLFLIFQPGCGKKASDEIDFGTIENSVYRNDYFGMSIEIPAGWSVRDREGLQAMLDFGGKVADDDKVLDEVMKASELQTVNLLGVFKHPLGSSVECNPNIMCLAERIRHLQGIKTGRDYHLHSKRLLQSTQMGVTFPEEIYTKRIGGVDFDVMTLAVPNAELVINQKQHVTVMKGYALMLITSFSSGEEEAELDAVLESVRFRE
jgi:hypothetical protein